MVDPAVEGPPGSHGYPHEGGALSPVETDRLLRGTYCATTWGDIEGLPSNRQTNGEDAMNQTIPSSEIVDV